MRKLEKSIRILTSHIQAIVCSMIGPKCVAGRRTNGLSKE